MFADNKYLSAKNFTTCRKLHHFLPTKFLPQRYYKVIYAMQWFLVLDFFVSQSWFKENVKYFFSGWFADYGLLVKMISNERPTNDIHDYD